MSSSRPGSWHSLRIAGWLCAYAVVAPLAWLARGRRRVVASVACLMVLVGVVALGGSKTATPLRIATFNIEEYGARQNGTDEPRLISLLRGLDADVVAVQEIEDTGRFAALVEGIKQGKRSYRFLSSRCGGKSDRHLPMHVGFVVDVGRVEQLGTVEYPELAPGDDDRCSLQERPGLLGAFGVDGRRFELLVVHFAAMPDQYARRQQQWDRALKIVEERQSEGVPVAIMGDVNSTGYLDDAAGERQFIRDRVGGAGMRLLTVELPCTEYFRREPDGALVPSALDHVAVTRDFPLQVPARVEGFCSQVGCRPIEGRAPADFQRVSDHCPVLVGGL